ncbi:hypothetical protein AAC387_Pa02g5059 [Persea americana]
MAQRQQRWRLADPPSLVTGMENRRGWLDLQTETGWSLLLRPFAIKKNQAAFAVGKLPSSFPLFSQQQRMESLRPFFFLPLLRLSPVMIKKEQLGKREIRRFESEKKENGSFWVVEIERTWERGRMEDLDLKYKILYLSSSKGKSVIKMSDATYLGAPRQNLSNCVDYGP